jgi:hypothetical protein
MGILKDYYRALSFDKKKPLLLAKPVTAPLYTRMVRQPDEPQDKAKKQANIDSQVVK